MAPELTNARLRLRNWHESDVDASMPSIATHINPVNAASIRVAEKLGATRDGAFVMHGKPHHVYRHHPH